MVTMSWTICAVCGSRKQSKFFLYALCHSLPLRSRNDHPAGHTALFLTLLVQLRSCPMSAPGSAISPGGLCERHQLQCASTQDLQKETLFSRLGGGG